MPILTGLDERNNSCDSNQDLIDLLKTVMEARDQIPWLLKSCRAKTLDVSLLEPAVRSVRDKAKSLFVSVQNLTEGNFIISKSAIELGAVEFTEIMERALQLTQAQNTSECERAELENFSELVSVIGSVYSSVYPEVRFHITIEPNCMTRMDAGEIKRCVENLLKNAVESLPAQGGEIWLSLSKATHAEAFAEIPKGLYARLHVKDNGCGISEDIMVMLSDSFVTTKPGGSGVGLKSVRNCVQRNGGHVFLESEKDIGTEVTMLLPLVEMPGVEPGSENEAKKPLQP